MKKYLLLAVLLCLSGMAYSEDIIGNFVTVTNYNNYKNQIAISTTNIITDMITANWLNLSSGTYVSISANGKVNDGKAYHQWVTSAPVSPVSGEVRTGLFEYNWYKGDNATFIADALEAVVRSRAVDTNMTGRGISARIYAGAGYTMKTGIGVEGAWRIEDTNHPAYGSSYAALRGWCYPGWVTEASSNVVNNTALWLENEHATNAVTNGIYLHHYGGGFTNDLYMQSGGKITNKAGNTVVINSTSSSLGVSTFTINADGLAQVQTFQVVSTSMNAKNIYGDSMVITGTATIGQINVIDMYVTSEAISLARSTWVVTNGIYSEYFSYVDFLSNINLNNNTIYGGKVIDVGIQVSTTILSSLPSAAYAMYQSTDVSGDMCVSSCTVFINNDFIATGWRIRGDLLGNCVVRVSSAAFGTPLGVIDGGASADNTKRPNMIAQLSSSGTVAGWTATSVGAGGNIGFTLLGADTLRGLAVEVFGTKNSR